MKKIILCLSLLFLLTACDVKYEITIDEQLKATEKIVVQGETNDYYWTVNERAFDDYLTYILNNNNNSHYRIINKEYANNKFLATFFSNYNSLSDLNEKSRYDFLYSKFTINTDNNIISFNASGNAIYEKEIEDEIIDFPITIFVKTPYSVVESNADLITGGVQSWTMSLDNIKEIAFKIDNTKKVTKIEKDDKSFVLYIYVLLGIMTLITIIKIYIKVKKSNKI